MTTRELREALFHLTDQDMTVKELRSMLFKVDDQDENLDLNFAMWHSIEWQHGEEKARLARLQEA